MDHPISLFILAAWPDLARANPLEGVAVALAWIISTATVAVLTVVSWLLAVLSWSPPLWARIAAPVAVVALAVWWVRWMNRPAKLGRAPRRRLMRPVDQRRDGER